MSAGASDSGAYLNYLKTVFNQQEKKLDDFLLAELRTYIDLFPDDQSLPEARYILSQVYHNQGNEHLEFAALMKVIFLHPDSPSRARAADMAHKLISKQKSYKKRADSLAVVIDRTSESTELVDRQFEYLSFLVDLNQPKLHQWTLDELYQFTVGFGDDAKLEQVQRWIAEIYAEDDKPRSAVAAYAKYEELYPENENLPDAMNQRAILLYRNLGQIDQAVELLGAVIEKFHGTKYAGSALYIRADIRTRKLKDFNGAIDDYRKLVTDQPEHKKAVDALFDVGVVHRDKLKEYRAAIAAFDEIVAKYPDDPRGIEALEESAKLYENKIKNYAKAAAQYARLSESFPEYEKSPARLFDAANICAKKLKDLNKAIEYLTLVTERYPATKHSIKAQKEITKAQAKLSKE